MITQYEALFATSIVILEVIKMVVSCKGESQGWSSGNSVGQLDKGRTKWVGL